MKGEEKEIGDLYMRGEIVGPTPTLNYSNNFEHVIHASSDLTSRHLICTWNTISHQLLSFHPMSGCRHLLLAVFLFFFFVYRYGHRIETKFMWFFYFFYFYFFCGFKL